MYLKKTEYFQGIYRSEDTKNKEVTFPSYPLTVLARVCEMQFAAIFGMVVKKINVFLPTNCNIHARCVHFSTS